MFVQSLLPLLYMVFVSPPPHPPSSSCSLTSVSDGNELGWIDQSERPLRSLYSRPEERRGAGLASWLAHRQPPLLGLLSLGREGLGMSLAPSKAGVTAVDMRIGLQPIVKCAGAATPISPPPPPPLHPHPRAQHPFDV